MHWYVAALLAYVFPVAVPPLYHPNLSPHWVCICQQLYVSASYSIALDNMDLPGAGEVQHQAAGQSASPPSRSQQLLLLCSGNQTRCGRAYCRMFSLCSQPGCCIFTLALLLCAGDGANSIKLFGQTPIDAPAGSNSSSLPGANSSSSSSHQEVVAMSPADEPAAANGVMHGGGAPGPWECLCSVDQAHDADVNCVRWHPQRHGLLASAGDDGVVKLWRHLQPSTNSTAAAAAAGS